MTDKKQTKGKNVDEKMVDKMIEKKLSPKEAAFCNHYLESFNGSESAKAVGYAPSGARAQASKLLSKPNIQQHLQKMTAKAAEEAVITAKRTLDELAAVVYQDVADLIDDDGRVIPLSAMPDHARRAISYFEIREDADGGRVTKVRLHPKNQAILMAMKYLGLLLEREQRNEAKSEAMLKAIARGRALSDARDARSLYYIIHNDSDELRLKELANGRVVLQWLQDLRRDTADQPPNSIMLEEGENCVIDLRGGKEQPIYLDHAEDAEFEMLDETPSDAAERGAPVSIPKRRLRRY